MPDLQNSDLQKDNSGTKEGYNLAARDELNNEAYRAMHDKSIAPQQAMFQIDQAFTKAESESSANRNDNSTKYLYLDHALWLDVYGFSHNSQAAKDRAVEVLKLVPESFRKENPEIVGALIQADQNRPIDLRDGKAAAVAYEKDAERMIQNSNINNPETFSAIRTRLANALFLNSKEGKAQWHAFDKDHKYDAILTAAQNEVDQNPPQPAKPDGQLRFGEHSPSRELESLPVPLPGEGDADGVMYLKGALLEALRDNDKNGDNKLSQNELETAATEALEHGDKRKSDALTFAADHFDSLHLSGKDDSIFLNHKGISHSDISELQNYDSYLRTGKWLGVSPLVSEADINRAAIIGAGLGALVEAATFLTPLGPAITSKLALYGSVGYGIGRGVVEAYNTICDPNISTLQKVELPPGALIVGAAGGAVAGALWGPFAGAETAAIGTYAISERVWNYRHRNEFESLFSKIHEL